MIEFFNERSVAILLSTFNSSKFLRDQLDSLYSQTFLEWSLYIRDDGSDDRTIEIVKTYQEKYKNIYIIEDNSKRIGPRDSFFKLLSNVDSNYYMFCDHDDVWLNDKVELTLNMMKNLESENSQLPILIHTDLVVVDENLNKVNGSFWKYSGIDPKLLSNFENLVVCNSITGCTMMINRYAKTIALPYSPLALMHDRWIALKVANAGGLIRFISESTILYRQHSSNTIGAKRKNITKQVYKMVNMSNLFRSNVATFRMVNEIRHITICQYVIKKIMFIFN